MISAVGTMLSRLGLCALIVVVMAPHAVIAQPAQAPRIGFLVLGSLETPETKAAAAAFRQGLRSHGYVEGESIHVEYRGADGNVQRLGELAAELAGLKVELIVAVGTPAGRAAKQATTTIPVVVTAMGDPVDDGLVTSLGRPGGNVTGTTFLGPALVPKHLELLKEALPRAASVAVLRDPRAFGEGTMKEMMQDAYAAARALSLRLHFTDVRSRDDLDAAFIAAARRRPDALVVFSSPMLFAERRRIVALATRHRLPTMFNNADPVELGGFMGYGTSSAEGHRRAAAYVDKILKGAEPADLPVEQPTTFEFVINLKTAKALGIVVPPAVRLRADRVIE
jgi:putative tryptophan/tyrosine transport system substrate-binding protein